MYPPVDSNRNVGRLSRIYAVLTAENTKKYVILYDKKYVDKYSQLISTEYMNCFPDFAQKY